MTARHATMMALPALALLFAASPAPAQDVRADIRIGTGPVQGRVVIGGRDRYGDRDRGRVVVVDRGPRVYERVVVERRRSNRVIVIDEDRRKAERQHRNHEKRYVRGYWDPRTNQFGFERWRPGLRAVLFCEHGNKYHLIDGMYDDRYDRGRRYGGDDRNDRDDRFDRYDRD